MRDDAPERALYFAYGSNLLSLEIIVAGAPEHGLLAEYIESLLRLPEQRDATA